MIELKDIKTVYFLGIGGIGMSALARYFSANGKTVSGYDRTSTSLTAALQTEGIVVSFEENVNAIPSDVDLVIYTPAVPRVHPAYDHFRKLGIPMMKRAQVLGLISAAYKTIGIAGTHGKTTIATLTAHLLTNSTLGCQAFLGGISKNYESNLLLSPHSRYLVAEADEFDRSFLQLHPEIEVITSVDADHLDIYGDLKAVKTSFTEFTANLKDNGILVLKEGIELEVASPVNTEIYRYGFDKASDFRAENLKIVEGLYHFDLAHPKGYCNDLVLGLPGRYNVENAVAASAAALLCGITEPELRHGLATFLGVCRRFDYRINRRDIIYIDDYAHHPEEIKACVGSARLQFPGKKLTGIFQPHLYTRTRDFSDEFAESLSLLDEVFILPIYPARELPIVGIDSNLIFRKMKNPCKHLAEKTELPAILAGYEVEVLITMGAGDIDTLVKPIEDFYNK
jgi:UDP-N-acetylmuramate--alanine ligase